MAAASSQIGILVVEEHLADALDAVRSYVAGREPLSETLQHVAETATRVLGADATGLTLLYPDGRAHTAVCTSDLALAIDRAQYEADRGPCLQAYRAGVVTVVDDTATDERWPEYARAALAHGIRSSLSSPLLAAGEGIGALNIYSSAAGHFTAEDGENASIFAAQAAIALANAQAYWQQATLAENLTRALDSRAVIEQAKGVIIATTGVTADAAFDLLRQQSQSENRKLREIAAEIVQQHQRSEHR